jgi:hypothetical protein
MLSVRTFVLGTLIPTAVVLASCAEPRVPKHAVKVERICQTSCRRQNACRADVDENACEQACAKGSRWRNFWRPDYVAAAAKCLESTSCEVIGDRAAREKSCFASTRLAPTAEAIHFCELLATKDTVCRRDATHALSTDRCLARYGMIEDETLGQMITCQQEKPCGPANVTGGRKPTRDDCMRDIVDDDGETGDVE